MRDIEAPDLLDALKKIEKQSPEAARRARQIASAVYQYAIPSRRATHDPAAGLVKSMRKVTPTRRPAVPDPKQVGALLRAIDTYMGQPVTSAALKLLALTFVRPASCGSPGGPSSTSTAASGWSRGPV